MTASNELVSWKGANETPSRAKAEGAKGNQYQDLMLKLSRLQQYRWRG